MDKINIIKCNFGTNYLIDIKNNATLELNDGTIENNSGSQSIIHVNTLGTLYLNGMVFRKNVQNKVNTPSCIKGEERGNISINKCQFLNHATMFCPYSGYLIETNGDLEINSSRFENNRPMIFVDSIRTIRVSKKHLKCILLNMSIE